MLKSKDTPAQKRERLQWIVDVVRENQDVVRDIFSDNLVLARKAISSMHKQDRDAILQPDGILTSEQIELLK